MAFAFALLGLLRGGIDVADSQCVAKSWPAFWDDLDRLGARVANS
jgi:5-enolpyruvylshikimate-3-phosphate synthase